MQQDQSFSKEVTHSHDKFVKASLSKQVVAIDFIRANLPTRLVSLIHFETLRLTNKSFVTQQLREQHSDVIYECTLEGGQNAYISFLIEHQSSADPFMAFRFRQYEMEGMQQHLSQDNTMLPIIISICLYHGRQSPYPYSTNIEYCFNEPELAKEFAFKPFYLVDLTVMDEKTLERQKLAQVMMWLLKYSRERNFFEAVLRFVGSGGYLAFAKEMDKNELGVVLEYIGVRAEKMGYSREEIFKSMIDHLPEEQKEMSMGFQQGWFEDGKQEGIQQGIQEGLQQGVRSIALNLLKRGQTEEFVQSVTNLSLSEIQQLRLSLSK